jgi:protein-L-isoaspartate(D-aspartate) O-methyltransferase
MDARTLREQMVDRQIAARGVRSEAVLAAMRTVPREAFMPAELAEFAYEDAPQPLPNGQTISQPYIVALMVEALQLEGGEKVLEVGAGFGYAAAVLAQIAGEVYTIETIAELAHAATENLRRQGYTNVRVRHGDGTLGWPELAPFEAIVVAAGSPDVPEALKEQLAVGGHLVIPVGDDPRAQELLRVTRVATDRYVTEELADVRFVPLIGAHGWSDAQSPRTSPWDSGSERLRKGAQSLAAKVAAAAEPFDDVDQFESDALLKRIGDATIVLIGEATHGTSEFYRLRAKITQALIERAGFRFVAIEGDWPDAARIDHYVRHMEYPRAEWKAFARFPQWMWRNTETAEFVEWLRERNAKAPFAERTALHGLDLYSMYTSIQEVIDYLDEVDPDAAELARTRYGCLTPWQADPARYGQAALGGRFQDCEEDVARMLVDILRRRTTYAERDGERYLDASQNARLIANAERYYRTMYYGSRSSWNLRDGHMYDTLRDLLRFYGEGAKGVVWAHNSHIGDARATEMSARDEYNIGQLCREGFGAAVYSIGFGTHDGTVAAASKWNGAMEVKDVRPSHPKSYEYVCHLTKAPAFVLPLRELKPRLSDALGQPRLERAIGVIYLPESELASHYFQASLSRQFDEYVWFDRTRAVTPFATQTLKGLPDTYPFGL